MAVGHTINFDLLLRLEVYVMKRITQQISTLSNLNVMAILGSLALLAGVLSFLGAHASPSLLEWTENILLNFSTEMLGAFLTFILIDLVIGGRERRNAERREELRRLRARLIKRMRSPDNELTSTAVSELRHRGWLEDGSLEGAYLSHSNLSGVDLSRADLQGGRFYKARLRGTELRFSDLQGTTLRVNQLAHAGSLRGATMPDGTHYDGRLRLESDLAEARNSGIDEFDNNRMAEFYGVPVEDYRVGQSWADRRLDHVRSNKSPRPHSSWWREAT